MAHPTPKIPLGVVLDLLDLYDLNIQIIYAFFEDVQHPPLKLNYYSMELTKEVRSIATKWHIEFDGDGRSNTLENEANIPFHFNGDLIIEVNWRSQDPRNFNWEGLDPSGTTEKMHAVRKSLKGLLKSERVDENDTKRDENIKELIEGVRRDIPEIVAEIRRKQALRLSAHQPERNGKVEITALPEVRVRHDEENVITKGKNRIHLPHFKPAKWPDITIRFITEREVVVTVGKENYGLDYEILGFADLKSDQPNKAWGFLYDLASHGGASEELPKPIPDYVKQQKKQLSDRLQAIFNNQTDPFYSVADTHMYRTRINLVPPQSVTEPSDKLGVEEYLSEVMMEK